MQISSLVGHTQEMLSIIFRSNRPVDTLIDQFFRSHKYLGSNDRKFIAGTTYGVLRHLRKCQHLLDLIIPEHQKDLSDDDRIYLTILIYFSLEGKLEEIKPTWILMNLKDEQLKEKLSSIVMLLGKVPEFNATSIIEKIGIEYSYPDWMVKRFIEEYGEEETLKLCSSMNEQARLNIRVNTLKTTVEECKVALEDEGIKTTPTQLSPFGLNIERRMNVFVLETFKKGWFEVQDEGSQLLPILIDPKPNEKLLDVCAGAGGKTLEFSALMKNKGEIFATDINSFRLKELKRRVKRAGAQNIRIIEIKIIEDLGEKYSEFFDIVFVDAPCSGLGTIRRNPGMKWLVTEQTVNEISAKQSAILESSSKLVKNGGKLIYATCTLLKQENSEVVKNFLNNNPHFNLTSFNKSGSIKNIIVNNNESFIQLLPHIHGTDAFFCVVLKKQSTN